MVIRSVSGPITQFLVQDCYTINESVINLNVSITVGGFPLNKAFHIESDDVLLSNLRSFTYHNGFKIIESDTLIQLIYTGDIVIDANLEIPNKTVIFMSWQGNVMFHQNVTVKAQTISIFANCGHVINNGSIIANEVNIFSLGIVEGLIEGKNFLNSNLMVLKSSVKGVCGRSATLSLFLLSFSKGELAYIYNGVRYTYNILNSVEHLLGGINSGIFTFVNNTLTLHYSGDIVVDHSLDFGCNGTYDFDLVIQTPCHFNANSNFILSGGNILFHVGGNLISGSIVTSHDHKNIGITVGGYISIQGLCCDHTESGWAGVGGMGDLEDGKRCVGITPGDITLLSVGDITIKGGDSHLGGAGSGIGGGGNGGSISGSITITSASSITVTGGSSLYGGGGSAIGGGGGNYCDQGLGGKGGALKHNATLMITTAGSVIVEGGCSCAGAGSGIGGGGGGCGGMNGSNGGDGGDMEGSLILTVAGKMTAIAGKGLSYGGAASGIGGGGGGNFGGTSGNGGNGGHVNGMMILTIAGPGTFIGGHSYGGAGSALGGGGGGFGSRNGFPGHGGHFDAMLMITKADAVTFTGGNSRCGGSGSGVGGGGGGFNEKGDCGRGGNISGILKLTSLGAMTITGGNSHYGGGAGGIGGGGSNSVSKALVTLMTFSYACVTSGMGLNSRHSSHSGAESSYTVVNIQFCNGQFCYHFKTVHPSFEY